MGISLTILISEFQFHIKMHGFGRRKGHDWALDEEILGSEAQPHLECASPSLGRLQGILLLALQEVHVLRVVQSRISNSVVEPEIVPERPAAQARMPFKARGLYLGGKTEKEGGLEMSYKRSYYIWIFFCSKF